MITIKNLKSGEPNHPTQIRVDRSSLWGNPFHLEDETKRDFVCDHYEDYFRSRLQTDENFRNSFLRLVEIYRQYGKLELFCWCKPKRCHAETIKKFIEEYIGGKNEN